MPASVNSREALAKLPVLRKSALQGPAGQDARRSAALPPSPAGALARMFMSPGPIFEPEGRGEDWWRTARALFAAGMRKGDIVHNTFAYHLTPGRLDPRCGCARARLRRHRRRPRQDRAAARGHPVPEADRLRRRAGLSEDPARQGQGGRQGRVLLQEGAGGRRRALPLAAGRVQAARHRHLSRPMPPPTSASSPTRARRSRA